MIRAIFAVLLLVAGCGHNIQTSSGQDWLAAAPVTESSGVLAKAITQSAKVEPDLKLPAKIGVARITNGRLTGLPTAEAALWSQLAERHVTIGELVPLSPLVTKMAASGGKWTVMEQVRIGAARQHMDAVLIYEIGAYGNKTNTSLAIADLTILGSALLPTRNLKATGIARAMLIGTRNGYPYLDASAQADLSGYSVSWGSDARQERMRDQALKDVTAQLIPEVDKALIKLRRELAKR